MKKLQVLILAGGIGKRKRPLVGDKLFIPILGKPLISFIVERVKRLGVEKIIMVGNEENLNKLKDYFKGPEFSFYLQKEGSGLAAAIDSVKDFSPDPLLILNGDDLFSPGFLKDFLEFVGQRKEEVILTGIKKEDYFPGGYFVLEGSQVKGVIEKPGRGKEPSQFVRLVVDYFKKPSLLLYMLGKIEDKKRDDVYELALDRIIKEKPVAFYSYDGSWAAVKYPWHILDFQSLLLNEYMERLISPKTEIAPEAKIEGKVCIEEGVKIFEGAVIRGPVYLGKNTIVGNHTLIRDSQIGDNCIIGSGTEIARSYIGPSCWLHRNYIGDSVLEEDVRFGAGALTANFRLDQKQITMKVDQERFPTDKEKLGSIIASGVRVGVNASLMPGVSIGEKAWVGPGVVLDRPLGAGRKRKK